MLRRYTLGRSWECLLKKNKSNLRFATIIIGAIRVRESDLSDPDAVSEMCSRATAMISGFKDDWLGITRGRHLSGFMWRGVFEIDLKRELPTGCHYSATLADLGCDIRALDHDERVLILHTHFVVVFPADHGESEENEADELRAVVQSVWPGRWQTQVKGLRSNQTVSEAIKNIYTYCHKRRLQYADGGINDEPVKFGDSYGWFWSRIILKVYDSFKSEFRSKR